MTEVIKGKALRQDLALYDGTNSTAQRKSSSGGYVQGLRVGDEVDVLSIHGRGQDRNQTTIQNCVNSLGSLNRSIKFATGTWTIESNTTIPANLTSIIPAGCVFSISSGITLTFSGPVKTDSDNFKTGSGTLTYTDDRMLQSVAGTNTITASTLSTLTALRNGLEFFLIPAATNTDAVTLNVNSTGAVSLRKNHTNGLTALVSGDLISGNLYRLIYYSSGPYFIVTEPTVTVSELSLIDDFSLSGYFKGFIPSNASDADHDLTFTNGVCRNTANTMNCKPTWSTITKQIDATFAEGTNAGGMATGSVASQTVYFCNLIMKNADNSVFDICYDVSATGANTPSGWAFRRCVFALITDSSSNILPFQAFEIGGGSVEIFYDALQAEFSTADPGTRRVNHTTLFVPQTPGNDVTGYYNFSLIDVTPAADTFMLINTQFEGDVAASTSMHHLQTQNTGAAAPTANCISMNLRVFGVGAARTISYRLDASNADITVKGFARGYRMDRAAS